MSHTPVIKLFNAPGVLVIRPSLPANSVKELIALAKKKPGEPVFASAGIGTHNHLGGELLKLMAGIDMKIVQFKGGAPSIVDLLGGIATCRSARSYSSCPISSPAGSRCWAPAD